MWSKPKKAAAKAEAERDRALRLVDERRVVELELFERVAKAVVLAFVGVEAAIHHRHRFAIAGQRHVRRIVRRGDRIADVDLAQRLDVRDHVADVAELKDVVGRICGAKKPTSVHSKTRSCAIDMNRVPAASVAVDDADVAHDAAIRIELRVEDQRAKTVAVALRRRNAVNDRLEDLLDPDAVLGAGENALALLHHEQLLDLAHDALRDRRPEGRSC